MQINPRVTVVVAAVAVTAVVTGGALAYRQSPQLFGSGAAPLTASVTPSVSQTPSSTPSAQPTPTPKPPGTPRLTPTPTPSSLAGPVAVAVDLAKLSKGRAPQLPYLVDREVRGGNGWARKIPGTDTIHKVARVGDDVLAVVSNLSRWQLIKVGPFDKSRYTPDVSSLVSSEDGTAAYAAVNPHPGGGVVYFEAAGSVRKLDVPAGALELKVLGLANGKVYYHWVDRRDGPWKLFEWTPGTATPKQIKTVVSPDSLSNDGAVAGSISDSAPAEGARTCSTVTLLATGKRLWRTCDSLVTGFTPDRSITIGTGQRGDIGHAGKITAQDTATGKVVREWTGSFGTVVPEDDQHLLIVAGDGTAGGDWTKSSIIRCAITTGTCEFAIGLTRSQLAVSGWS